MNFRQLQQNQRSAVNSTGPPPFFATPAPAGWYSAVPTTPLQLLAPPTPAMPTAMPTQPPPAAPFAIPVHEVWADNFHCVEATLGYFIAHAACVAIDVHYPGVIHGDNRHGLTTEEKRYAMVKANVDTLKLLQLGLTIAADDGRMAAWEFNLSDFDPAVDPHAKSSMSYLERRGLKCDELRLHGIPVARLARALRLISRPGVSWVTHTGAYHVAYLMKIINGGNQLPRDLAGFMAAVRRSLGEDVYDVAKMASDCHGMPAGLECIASRLGVAPPLSMRPLAGAGSVLALQAFMKLRYLFRGNIARYRGVLKGLHAA